LPFPDRELWHEWTVQRPRTHHALLSSRGCPYNCPYCANHALRKIAPGQFVRLRPPADVLEEIKQLRRAYPETTDIYLQSETIAMNLDWLKEVTGQIKAFNDTLDHPISFTTNFRVARRFVTDAVFESLEQANVKTLEIGLESGSERVRSEILQRHYTNDQFFEAVSLARRHGMQVNVYNMIGLPGETPADHQMTIEVNRRVNPARSNTGIFYPYPGTDLFTRCQDQGLVANLKDPTSERTQAVLNQPEFSPAQVQKAYEWFEYRIYRGHHSFPFRLRKVLRNKIACRRWANALFTRLLPLWYALKAGRRARKPATA